MNIGFDASRAFNKNRTGTENYSYQLLYNLSKLDHTNNYYIYIRPNADTTLKDWPSNFKFITIPYPRLWTQVGLAKQTFKDTDLDVLFVPSHTLPLVKRPGLKTIVTVHDLGAEYLPKTHQLKQRAYLKLMTDYQLKSATHIIAVSKATKDDLIKKVKINPNKISVIYEGYDNKAFKPLKNDEFSDVLKYYDIESNNYFLFVGTIQPRKNLAKLISAYAQFLRGVAGAGAPRRVPASEARTSDGGKARQDPELTLPKLILAGGKGWLSDEIYELPKKLGIEDQVKFLGYVPDENLPALYNGAKGLLFPSLFEGFGLPILEAMACACPVLTSNISSMPEIAGEAAILVNPYLEEEIAQGISKLFNDKNLSNKLETMGIAQSKKFSWEKCAQETLLSLTSTSK
ncbi:MAG: glycosyltransferase family 1 protein [Candidatus Daviesbacteria bacterium]|nr:glycosyltransferase family 1 protein [Candidatus Daviesbacteria bacterium]